MKNFLLEYGPVLIDLGYEIVPILAGSKGPQIKDWTQKQFTVEMLKGFTPGHTGCGIKCHNMIAVDIDCYENELAQEVYKFTTDLLGYSPYRIGEAPKLLIPYRCTSPIKKKSSRLFQSIDGVVHRVEVLGSGQQFVAAHIHPKTHLPYIWHYEDGQSSETLTLRHSALPVISGQPPF